VLSEDMAQSFSENSEIHMYFSFVYVVMFSHNGLYGMWQWHYLHECHTGVSCHNFSTYSPGGTTLFDFVVVHNGSKFDTGSISNDDTWMLQLVGGPQCVVQKLGAVCSLQFALFFSVICNLHDCT